MGTEDDDDVLPPFPSKDSNKTAFDYFNHPYFFDEILNKDSQIYYVKNRRDSTVLQVTLDEFFQAAPDEEKDRSDFLRDNIPLCKYTAVLEAYDEWKGDNDIGRTDDGVKHLPRLVNVDFRIQDSNLSHTYDLDCFSKRVDQLFKCHENDKERENYVAPYFCFVQSSGMGKTKLLYEYKRVSFANSQVASFLMLPPNVETDEPADERGIFESIDLGSAQPPSRKSDNEMGYDLKMARPAAAMIFSELDKKLEKLVTGAKNHTSMKDIRKVALLFDESQYLLEKEFGYDAFRFRCVRLWLREIPSKKTFRGREKLTVVAVFTGTSLKLTNFLIESDNELATFFQPSRQFQLRKRKYYFKGDKVHDPFSQTTTMGSCLGLLQGLSGLSEYERAVYHGRPLFALMAKNRILEKNIPSILLRMLRHVQWTEDNQNGWINVLSTRVQLGQLPAEVASDLVANAYANLCAYNSNSRSVLLDYLPDPVAASLAMCMMDERFKVDVTLLKETVTIKGKSKQWWIEKLKEIFATGMVSPDKGDFGEVVVALYMLFCGDLLRMRIKDNTKRSAIRMQPFRRFSVSLDAWLHLMLSGGIVSDVPSDQDKVSVGFIQVCRNPLRAYSDSWKSLNDQGFLKQMFESGVAFYTFDGCPLIDMVVPVRIRSDEVGNVDGFCYAPMLVSIKCRRGFRQCDAKAACKKLKARAVKANLTRALCLLIVFGSEEKAAPFKGDIAIEKDTTAVSDQLMEGIVTKAIRVPTKDVFGLASAFNAMVSTTQIEAELLASHPYLKAHGPDTAANKGNYADLKAVRALRHGSYTKWEDKYNAIRAAMTGSKPEDVLPETSSKAKASSKKKDASN